jgi:serine/threonine protein phosphatase PrpC
LTRAFGDLDFKKNKTLKAEEQVITADPEIKKISKDDLYFIMMGCDGIWECKEESELMNWVKARLDKRRDLGKTL